MSSIDRVPEGYELRAASVEDAAAIADVVNETMLAELGTPWTSTDEVRDELTLPGRDNERDDALLVEPDGTLAGSLQIFDFAPFTEIEAVVYVRPRRWGRGLSAWLIRLAEERARARVDRAPPGERVVVQVARLADNEPARRLFESLGYEYARTFWLMRVDLGAPPTPVRVPRGIRIRTFEPGRDDVALHAAMAEAFADHWGAGFPSFEEWRHFGVEGEGSRFDPTLWFLAVDGDEIVGAACCKDRTARDPGSALVDDLAVRRPWRGRGIGLALLLTAFAEFHRRGIARAELGVDAENPTGAVRLYERAGMHAAFSWEFWQKELRPAAAPG
jgi:mycothiol synthase